MGARVARVIGTVGIALALFACRRPEVLTNAPAANAPAATASPTSRGEFRPLVTGPPDDLKERGNLLNLAHGAVVVSRTGEGTLETSAVAAIDGDQLTNWTSPPGDRRQSLIVALPSRSRIDKIGGLVGERAPAGNATFESSTDGVTFAPLGSISFKSTDDLQLVDVKPVDASYLRVTMDGGGSMSSLVSAQARGAELEKPHEPSLAGCWSLNGDRAQFAQHGARVSGSIALTDVASNRPDAHQSMRLDGGSDGRFFRFAWFYGNEFGFAGIATSADGRSVNGIEWHEEAIPLFYATTWLGSRRSCDPQAPPQQSDDSVARFFLGRAHRFPLYGLKFDPTGKLDVDASGEALAMLGRFLKTPNVPFHLVAHEFHEAGADKNRARCERELASLQEELQRLRIDTANATFIAAGSDRPRQEPYTEVQRAIYSVIELEVPPPQTDGH